MDTGKVVLFGALGLGAYYLYSQYTASAAAAPAPTAGATPPAPTPGPVIPPAVVSAAVAAAPVVAPAPSVATTNALDSAYQAMKAAVGADPNFHGSGDSMYASPDHWNAYLSYTTGFSAPLGTLFPGDRTQNVTAAGFWAAVAPSVKQYMGLAGLGVYAGLGQLVHARRSWR